MAGFHKGDDLTDDIATLNTIKGWIEEMEKRVRTEYDRLSVRSKANEPLFLLMQELENRAAGLGVSAGEIQDEINGLPSEVGALKRYYEGRAA